LKIRIGKGVKLIQEGSELYILVSLDALKEHLDFKLIPKGLRPKVERPIRKRVSRGFVGRWFTNYFEGRKRVVALKALRDYRKIGLISHPKMGTHYYKQMRKVAKKLGFEERKIGKRIVCVKRREVRFRPKQKFINAAKTLLANIEEIAIKDLLIKMGLRQVGGAYYKLVRQAAKEQGFKVIKKEGLQYLVKLGRKRKQKTLYSGFPSGLTEATKQPWEAEDVRTKQ